MKNDLGKGSKKKKKSGNFATDFRFLPLFPLCTSRLCGPAAAAAVPGARRRRAAAPDDVVGQRLLGFLRSIAVLEDFVGGAELQHLPQRVLGEERQHIGLVGPMSFPVWCGNFPPSAVT